MMDDGSGLEGDLTHILVDVGTALGGSELVYIHIYTHLYIFCESAH